MTSEPWGISRRHALGRRGPVSMKAFDRLEPPGLSLLALGLRPGDRLPVRIENEARPRIRDLDPITGRFIDVEEERLLDRVLVRAGLDEDAVLEKDIGRLENLFSLIDRVGNVVKATSGRRVIAGVGDV